MISRPSRRRFGALLLSLVTLSAAHAQNMGSALQVMGGWQDDIERGIRDTAWTAWDRTANFFTLGHRDANRRAAALDARAQAMNIPARQARWVRARETGIPVDLQRYDEDEVRAGAFRNAADVNRRRSGELGDWLTPRAGRHNDFRWDFPGYGPGETPTAAQRAAAKPGYLSWDDAETYLGVTRDGGGDLEAAQERLRRIASPYYDVHNSTIWSPRATEAERAVFGTPDLHSGQIQDANRLRTEFPEYGNAPLFDASEAGFFETNQWLHDNASSQWPGEYGGYSNDQVLEWGGGGAGGAGAGAPVAGSGDPFASGSGGAVGGAGSVAEGLGDGA